MSRSPDYILKAMDKVTDAKSGKLGCAWVNDDGSLTVVFDPGTSISYNPNLVIKLFPNDLEGVKQNAATARARGKRKAKAQESAGAASLPPTSMLNLPVSVKHRLEN